MIHYGLLCTATAIKINNVARDKKRLYIISNLLAKFFSNNFIISAVNFGKNTKIPNF